MKIKRILANIIILIMLCTTVLGSIPINAQTEESTQKNEYAIKQTGSVEQNNQDENEKEYSEAYKAYLALSDEEKAKVEVIPRKYDIPLDSLYEETNKNTSRKSRTIVSATNNERSTSSIPSSYDLRDVINIPIRDQKSYGNCWNFASLKTIETNLALKGIEKDLSELHVDYVMSDEFIQDGRKLHSGGSFQRVARYLMKNYGPVLESEVPYDEVYEDEQYEYLMSRNIEAYVEDVIDFPTIDKEKKQYTQEELSLFRNKVKKQIMENGALYAVVENPGHADVYDSKTHTLFSTKKYEDIPGDKLHAIDIIGWDDNYSKENFPENNRPKSDGAYICVNSWGESWGDKGFFYVSYEDYYIETEISGVINATEEKNTKNIKFEDENLYLALKEIFRNEIISYNDNSHMLELSKIVLNQWEELDLSNKGISSISGLENFVGLTELKLNNNSITDVSAIATMTKLRELELEHNNITDATAIINLEKIYMLNLGYNNISSVECAKNKTGLLLLKLNNNSLTDVSELKNIKTKYGYELDLSGNTNLTGLEKLEPGEIDLINLSDCNLDDTIIPILQKLKIGNIELRNNNIVDAWNLCTIPNLDLDLSGNKNIDPILIPTNGTSLKVANCNISNLENFAEDFNGYNLDLSDNPIDDSQLQYIKNNSIRYLYINNTNIKDVSELTNIEGLYIDGNKNVTGVENLTQLKYLSMNDCGLTDLNFMQNLTNLSIVYMNSNKLTNTDGIKELSNITKLYMEKCELEDINFLEKLINVSELYLDNNNIANIEVLSNLKKLWILYMNNNKIQDISSLSNLESLSILSINKNKINNLALSHKGRLYEVYADDNGITNIDNKYLKYTESAKNQKIEINKQIQLNVKTEFELPNLFKTLNKNRYVDKTSITTKNCTIDYNNGLIEIEPHTLGTLEAVITIENGIFKGTEYKINCNVVSKLDILGLKVLSDEIYTEGDKFNKDTLKVYYQYLDGGLQEITDYTKVKVQDVQNLTKGQTIAIEYKGYTLNYEPQIYGKDETVTILCKEDRFYDTVYARTAQADLEYKDSILYKSKDLLKMVVNINRIDEIEDITIGEKVVDITGISKLYNLNEVNINYSDVEDITEIGNLQNLKSLYVYNSKKIADIQALKNNSNLAEVFLNGCSVRDISPLKDLPKLESVDIGNTEITDISCLENNKNIKMLDIWDISKIANIGKLLDNRNLETQIICQFDVNDLTVIDEKIMLPQYMQVAMEQDDIDDKRLGIYEIDENGNIDYSTGKNGTILQDSEGQRYISKQIFDGDNIKIAKLYASSGDYRYNMYCTIKSEASEVYTNMPIKQIDGKECITTLNGQNNKVGDVLVQANFPNTKYSTVAKDKNGKTLANTDKLGTGSTIELKDNANNIVKTYYIVISGDIDGDGRVRSKDLMLLINHLSGKNEITDKLQRKAADVLDEGNDRIRSNDLNELYKILSR